MNKKHGASTTNFVIQLHPDDNVTVCLQPVTLDQICQVGITELTIISELVNVGHKVACQSIAPGDPIIKYGVPIGSAILAISKGEHVHLHNMKSDYIPPHNRQTRYGHIKSTT